MSGALEPECRFLMCMWSWGDPEKSTCHATFPGRFTPNDDNTQIMTIRSSQNRDVAVVFGLKFRNTFEVSMIYRNVTSTFACEP